MRNRQRALARQYIQRLIYAQIAERVSLSKGSVALASKAGGLARLPVRLPSTVPRRRERLNADLPQRRG